MTDLAGRWPEVLAGSGDLRKRLTAAYDASDRGYHDLTHLTEMFAALDRLAEGGEIFDRDVVGLAVWFHDAVYEAGGDPSDEERSARLAEEELTAAGLSAGTVAAVARLVRMTETHHPADADGRALCDADLAILASTPERYAAYVAGVRREYVVFDDATFAAGRAAVLADLAARERLFSTDTGRDLWERSARKNLSRELASYGAAPPPRAD